MFDPPPQQPQSISDIIGRAFRIYRGHISLFLQTLLVPTAVVTFGRVCLQWSFVSGLNIKNTGNWFLTAFLCVLGLCVTLYAIWLLTLRQLAFLRAANGFDESYEQAYVYISKKQWSVFALLGIGYLLFIAACAFLGLEVGLAALCFKQNSALIIVALLVLVLGSIFVFAGVILLFLMASMVCAVVACEQKTLPEMIGRSVRLTWQNFGRAAAFALLLLLTIWLLSVPLSLPMVLLSIFEVFRNGMNTNTLTDPSKTPFYFLVIAQAWESTVNMVLWPITFIAFGLLYYDLRIRQEGLDVMERLKRLRAARI